MGKYYETNLSDEMTGKLYEAYKKKKGIPHWCPLSDAERKEFDKYVIHAVLREKLRRSKKVNEQNHAEI